VRFTRAISSLHDYSLLEVYEGRYSLHTGVHDWTLECLNQQFDEERCGMAIRCVAASVSWESDAQYWARNRRVLAHARRFQLARFTGLIDWSRIEPNDLVYLAALYQQNDLHVEAEEMYVRALRGMEKAWGPEHTSTLDTVNNSASSTRTRARWRRRRRCMCGRCEDTRRQSEQIIGGRRPLPVIYVIYINNTSRMDDLAGHGKEKYLLQRYLELPLSICMSRTLKEDCQECA
jgi:hypothetical protein